MERSKTGKRLTGGIVVICFLVICLCITTFALAYATVSVEYNIFSTGSVKINLNDGKRIIEEDEYLFEPGMTVDKEFFIENDSTWSVYYKVYFKNVSGGLADIIQITFLDGETELWSGTAKELDGVNVSGAERALEIGEKRVLTARFYYPPTSGNEGQNQIMAFDLCADAVQTKNNPYRLFK